MAIEQFGLTQDDVMNKDRVINLGSKQMTVRQILIDLGQLYRAIDPDFWANKLWKNAAAELAKDNSVVIDDMRFKNEANLLVANGAKLIRIERPGIPHIDDASETDLDDYAFSLRIRNDGTLEDYKRSVMAAIESLGIGSPVAK